MDRTEAKIKKILEKEIAAEYRELAVKMNEPLAKSLREHRLLEEVRRRVEAESRPLAAAMKEWPKLEADVKANRTLCDEMQHRVQILKDESTQAQRTKSIQEQVKKYHDASVKKVESDGAEAKLKHLVQVTDEAYSRLTSYHDNMEKMKAKLEGGKLSLAITARKPMDVRITKDLEAQRAEHLESTPLQMVAGGKIAVEHIDWTMEVQSGTINFEILQKDFQQTLDNQESVLKELGVSSLAEAKEAHECYQEQARTVDRLKAQLEQILAGDSYDELEKIAKLPGQTMSSRSLEAISADLATANTTLAQIKKETNNMSDRLADLAREQVSYERLLEVYTDKRAELKEVNANLEKLTPIPTDIGEPKGFIDKWDSKSKELDVKQKAWNQHCLERVRIEALAPPESEVDLLAQMKDAEASLDQMKRKGNALVKVQEVFNHIRQATDLEPLAPWTKSLGEILAPITSGRFRSVSLADNVPGGAIRTDGVEVPTEILSGGTRVGLGLALRLSMAERFLEQEDGFVVLDDPMVDMDPERQGATAAILQTFARHKQVIVVTCHPDHAKLIGGNIISLKGPTEPNVKVRHSKKKVTSK